MIEENVLAVIQTHIQSTEQFLERNGVTNDYGFNALTWLEGYIESDRVHQTEQEKNALINGIGAFFGECLRRTYNGEWVDNGQQIGIWMDKTLTAMPFNKVAKYFDDPLVNSFAGMFRATETMLKMAREKQLPPKPGETPNE